MENSWPCERIHMFYFDGTLRFFCMDLPVVQGLLNENTLPQSHPLSGFGFEKGLCDL
jgi:hypothetical protein